MSPVDAGRVWAQTRFFRCESSRDPGSLSGNGLGVGQINPGLVSRVSQINPALSDE